MRKLGLFKRLLCKHEWIFESKQPYLHLVLGHSARSWWQETEQSKFICEKCGDTKYEYNPDLEFVDP